MERNNHLSENLRAYQNAKNQTLAEFSQELGVARSTVQSIMVDGNTTVDTLVLMANALQVTLDDLVFGGSPIKNTRDVQHFLRNVGWFTRLPGEKQEKFRYHLHELLKLLEYDHAGN